MSARSCLLVHDPSASLDAGLPSLEIPRFLRGSVRRDALDSGEPRRIGLVPNMPSIPGSERGGEGTPTLGGISSPAGKGSLSWGRGACGERFPLPCSHGRWRGGERPEGFIATPALPPADTRPGPPSVESARREQPLLPCYPSGSPAGRQARCQLRPASA